MPGCVFTTAFCPITPSTTASIPADTLLLEVGGYGPWHVIVVIAREVNSVVKDEATGCHSACIGDEAVFCVSPAL